MSRAIAIIKASLAKIAVSDAPGIVRQRFAGEIDMAYKLGLIDYTEHDQHTTALAAACKHRLDELHAAKLKRLGIRE